jgi:hypothetical protein
VTASSSDNGADGGAVAALGDAVLREMPLAKLRLLREGSDQVGRHAARLSAIVIAAELRLLGVSEKDALATVFKMPFSPDSTPERKVRASFADAVRFAFHPPDGRPILSGCPGSARLGSTGSPASTLRRMFECHCDESCERTCPILRRARDPESVIAASPFAAVYRSSLWVSGGTGAKLGAVGREVYAHVAALSASHPGVPIRASSRWLSVRCGCRHSDRRIRDVLKRFHELGLVMLTNRRLGCRLVEVRSEEWVAALEDELGTRRETNARYVSVLRQRDDYLRYLNEWTDAEEMVAGTGPC